MIEAEEKNSLLNYLEGRGIVAMDDLDSDDPFVMLYSKYQSTLIEDGYVQVYKKPSAIIAKTSVYLRITKIGRAFIDQGGY